MGVDFWTDFLAHTEAFAVELPAAVPPDVQAVALCPTKILTTVRVHDLACAISVATHLASFPISPAQPRFWARSRRDGRRRSRAPARTSGIRIVGGEGKGGRGRATGKKIQGRDGGRGGCWLWWKEFAVASRLVVSLRRFRVNTEAATSVLTNEENVLRGFGMELTFVSKPEFSVHPNGRIEARIP
jgi:hypothetical protein